MSYFINAKNYIESQRVLALEELELEKIKYEADKEHAEKEVFDLLIKKQEIVVKLAKYSVDKYFKLIDGKTAKDC